MDTDTLPEVLAERFRLRRELGRGGMARVYLADDEKLDRPVALKVVDLRTDIDGRARERLLREAQRAAALNHPNIVHIHDVGTDGGRAYIVMEYVDGTTLQDLLDTQGPVTPDRAVEIGIAVCDALAAAHRLGIVHRDIKPSNVLIDADGQVKVTDFGIARANAGDTLTEEHPLGSAHYIAPEQLLTSHVDARADLYALGAVLFELVAGRPPFQAPTVAATAWQRLRVDPPDLSEHATVPAGLASVVRQALARDCDDRHANAEELGAALMAVPASRDTQPLDAPASDDVVAAPAIRASGRWWSILLAAVLLLAGAVGAGGWWRTFAPPAMVTVPDVRGVTIDQAVQRLRERGLELGEVRRVARIGDAGGTSLLVSGQVPERGASVPRGEPVHLEVSIPIPPGAGDEALLEDLEDEAGSDEADEGSARTAEDRGGADRRNAPPGKGGVPPGKGGDPPGKGKRG